MTDLPQTQSELKLTLRPAHPDFTSLKVQVIWALVAALVLTISVYSPVLSSGFLLDDFLHLDYVMRALAGDSHDFLANFTGNWAGSDIMRSFRPLASLSLFVDAVFWRTNAWGYHLTNVLLTFGSGLFVAFITAELTGLYGNRLRGAAAVWAALLFILYPLHPEAAAWIIGRVDVLCTFFYLVSLWSYLRFRTTRSKPYLYWSLLSFIVSLLSKEMAVTLPIVIASAEILLFGSEGANLTGTQKSRHMVLRTAGVLSFWFVLGTVAAFRCLALGTVVGGYDATETAMKVSALKNFLDKASLLKVLFPANEEIFAVAWFKPILTGCYLSACGVAIVRLLLRSLDIKVILFLVGWIVVSVVPTFQIWHIHPNLVGSRLIYLGSAPLCILLSLLALPAIDALPKKLAQVLTGLGAVILACVAGVWTQLLIGNLVPWHIAGEQMQTLRRQVKDELATTAGGNYVLFLDLPTDYKGSGMLTRPLYLELLSDKEKRAGIRTIEPPVSGSHEFLWPGRFSSLSGKKSCLKILLWSRESGRFQPWQATAGQAQFSTDFQTSQFSVTPPELKPTEAGKWRSEGDDHQALEAGSDFLNVIPGKKQIRFDFKNVDLNAMQCDALVANMKVSAARPQAVAGKIKIVWLGTQSSGESRSGEAWLPINEDGSVAPFWIGRLRAWKFAGEVKALALVFEPGEYEVKCKSLSMSALPPQPALSVDSASGKVTISAAATPANPHLLFTHANHTFDANAISEIAGRETSLTGKVVDVVVKDAAAPVDIPAELRREAGLHQVRLVVDGSDFPGEPVDYVER